MSDLMDAIQELRSHLPVVVPSPCDWCHTTPTDGKGLRPVPGVHLQQGGRRRGRRMEVCATCAPRVAHTLRRPNR